MVTTFIGRDQTKTVEDKAFEGNKEKVEDSLLLSQRYLKQFVI